MIMNLPKSDVVASSPAMPVDDSKRDVKLSMAQILAQDVEI